jgi:hypothetical protein
MRTSIDPAVHNHEIRYVDTCYLHTFCKLFNIPLVVRVPDVWAQAQYILRSGSLHVTVAQIRKPILVAVCVIVVFPAWGFNRFEEVNRLQKNALARSLPQYKESCQCSRQRSYMPERRQTHSPTSYLKVQPETLALLQDHSGVLMKSQPPLGRNLALMYRAGKRFWGTKLLTAPGHR